MALMCECWVQYAQEHWLPCAQFSMIASVGSSGSDPICTVTLLSCGFWH